MKFTNAHLFVLGAIWNEPVITTCSLWARIQQSPEPMRSRSLAYVSSFGKLYRILDDLEVFQLIRADWLDTRVLADHMPETIWVIRRPGIDLLIKNRVLTPDGKAIAAD